LVVLLCSVDARMCMQAGKGVVVRDPGVPPVDAAGFPELSPLLPLFGSRLRVTLSDGRRIVGLLQVHHLASHRPSCAFGR
jgi:hypothetical protein